MPLRREELSLTYVKVETTFPPVDKFSGTTIPEPNLAICQRHNLEGYHVEGDAGVHFYTEGDKDIELDRGSLSVAEHIRKDIGIVKRDFADIIDIVQKQLKVQAFFGPDYTMRALWPMGQDVGPLLQAVLNVKDDQLGLLKMGVEGLGFSIFVADDSVSGPSHARIRIQPYLADTSQVFIEFNHHSHEVVETPAVIEQGIQATYDSLFHNVAAFVESLGLDGGN